MKKQKRRILVLFLSFFFNDGNAVRRVCEAQVSEGC